MSCMLTVVPRVNLNLGLEKREVHVNLSLAWSEVKAAIHFTSVLELVVWRRLLAISNLLVVILLYNQVS